MFIFYSPNRPFRALKFWVISCVVSALLYIETCAMFPLNASPIAKDDASFPITPLNDDGVIELKEDVGIPI